MKKKGKRMEYFFTDTQREIKDLTHKFAREKIKPVRQELDRTGEFPFALMKEMAELGLMGIYIPEEYGGFGGGILEMCLVVEELSRIDGAVALGYAACGLGTFPILLAGTEEQKRRFLPRLAQGELAAFAITEAQAGSDASNVKTRARRAGDYYILNGTKQFITNGSVARWASAAPKPRNWYFRTAGFRRKTCWAAKKVWASSIR
jgi:butyryl-CoA dehydrogenase